MKLKIALFSLIAVLFTPHTLFSQLPDLQGPDQTLLESTNVADSGFASGIRNAPVIDPATGAVLDPAAIKLLNAAQEAWQRRVPEVNFASAQLDEVVEFLSEHFPEINFVLPEGNLDFEVSLQLRSVTLEELLKALEFSSNGMINGRREDHRLVVFQIKRAKELETPKPVLRAYNLKNYLPGAPILETQFPERFEKVNEARMQEFDEKMDKALYYLDQTLQKSFALMSAADPENENYKVPDINIERGTQLLIAVGTRESLEVVDQVVGALIGKEEKGKQDLLEDVNIK